MTTSTLLDSLVESGMLTASAQEIADQVLSTHIAPSGNRVLDDASRAALANTGYGSLNPYIGLVATRTGCPNAQNTTNKQLMMRSKHFASVNLRSIALIFANWYLNSTTQLETNSGGDATYKAAIEYPPGTIAAQVTWGGSASGTAPDGTTLVSDFAAVDIPKGAAFFIRTWVNSPGGIVYLKDGDALNLGGSAVQPTSGESWTLGVTTSDTTMAPGNFTNTGGSAISYRPAGIIGLTTAPSFAICGDSRQGNDNALDAVTDGFGYCGEFERSLAPFYACTKLSMSSERVYNLTSKYAKRLTVATYASHIISGYGVNDMRDSRSAAQILAAHQNFAALFGGKPVYVSTIAPYSSSTDSFATVANQTPDATVQPLRIAYNALIRFCPSPFAGCFEVADQVESARDSGKWQPLYTADGLHANSTGSLALYRSRAVYPGI